MTIKEFAFSAQKQLEVQTSEKFKRTHIYEFLAALYGYRSFAALCVESIVCEEIETSKYSLQHNLDLRQRCVELGYQSSTADIVLSEFPSFIAKQRIRVVNIAELISKLLGEFSYQDEYSDWDVDDSDDEIEDNSAFDLSYADDYFYEDELSPEILTRLGAAAEKNNPNAHYALALFLIPDVDYDLKSGAEYWYTQEQKGRMLSGVEKEWADNYAHSIKNTQKYEFHLREAARLGNEKALLDLAEHFGDPSFFDKANKGLEHDRLRVAEIAEGLGRRHDLHDWLTKAAKSGDIKAMRRLIEEFEQDDLLLSWTWVYLAKLQGTDLTKDNYYAINEDGSQYDDDVGGSMYVNGQGGVKLSPLTQEKDTVAREKAQLVFEATQ